MIRRGTRAVTKLYRGAREAVKAYRGTRAVYEKAQPPAPTGVTRLYLTLPDAATKTLVFQPEADGAVIDWGDGSAPESVASSSGSAAHAYAAAGDYVVSIRGTIKYLGMLLGTHNILNQQTGSKGGTSPELTAVEFGDVENVCPICFNNCTSLTEIKVPATVAVVWQGAFDKTTALKKAELAARQIDPYAVNAPAIEKVWLRNTAEEVTAVEGTGEHAGKWFGPFYGCPDTLVLYCEPASRPAGWSEHFDEYDANGSKLTVVWGRTTRPW
ncbi:MAG: hypothetical protein K6G17_01595 [Oscillospiraceae bacterium]|nr:hypothetical protein [Oscillospiraceae bacterium]